MTIPDPVRRHATQRPDAPALVTGAETWTWADLDARVGAAARRLEAGPERVAVRAETSPALVALVLGAFRSGRLLVPLSTRWTDAAVEAACERLGLDAPLTEADLGGMDAGERGEAPPVPLDRPVTVVHTSGSTGAPKAVVHSVGNHVWSARGVVEALGVTPRSRWLLDLPLYHVGGLGVVVRCALAGATVCVPPRGLSPARCLEALRPTHASFVATQLRRLLEADADLAGLEAVLLGGSAIPPDLLDEAVDRGVPVVTSYGMTEMTSTVTATAPGADRAALATSGRPLPYRELRIAASGEIEVSGPARAVGTLGPGGLEAAPPWHRTGDLGRLDADGRLVVTGRADLQFVSGGENVRPETIEAALLALEAVVEAVVVPVPDAEFGARPVAFVRTAGGLDGPALEAALRRTVPGFMVPVAFHPWAGAAGLKPDRPALARVAERRAAEKSG